MKNVYSIIMVSRKLDDLLTKLNFDALRNVNDYIHPRTLTIFSFIKFSDFGLGE